MLVGETTLIRAISRLRYDGKQLISDALFYRPPTRTRPAIKLTAILRLYTSAICQSTCCFKIGKLFLQRCVFFFLIEKVCGLI